jgi:hypothetical protein
MKKAFTLIFLCFLMVMLSFSSMMQIQALIPNKYDMCESLATWTWDTKFTRSLSTDRLEGNYSIDISGTATDSSYWAYPSLVSKASCNWTSTNNVFGFWIKILTASANWGQYFEVRASNGHYLRMVFYNSGAGTKKSYEVKGTAGEFNVAGTSITENVWYWIEMQVLSNGAYVIKGNGTNWYSGDYDSVFSTDTYARTWASFGTKYGECKTDYWRFASGFEFLPETSKTLTFNVEASNGTHFSYIPINVNGTNYYNGETLTVWNQTYSIFCSIPSNVSSFLSFGNWSKTGTISIADSSLNYTTIFNILTDGTLTLNIDLIPQNYSISFLIFANDNPVDFASSIFLNSVEYANGRTSIITEGTYSLDGNQTAHFPHSYYEFDYWTSSGSISIASNESITTTTISGNGTINLYLIDNNPYLYYTDRIPVFIGLGSGFCLMFLPMLILVLVKRESDLWERIKLLFIGFMASLLLGALVWGWLMA